MQTYEFYLIFKFCYYFYLVICLTNCKAFIAHFFFCMIFFYVNVVVSIHAIQKRQTKQTFLFSRWFNKRRPVSTAFPQLPFERTKLGRSAVVAAFLPRHAALAPFQPPADPRHIDPPPRLPGPELPEHRRFQEPVPGQREHGDRRGGGRRRKRLRHGQGQEGAGFQSESRRGHGEQEEEEDSNGVFEIAGKKLVLWFLG